LPHINDSDSDTVCVADADCGWNVTKALSSVHPTVAVAVPTAAAATSLHCVESSSTARVSSMSQHSAVTQQQQQQNDADGDDAVSQTPKLTEQGQNPAVCYVSIAWLIRTETCCRAH